MRVTQNMINRELMHHLSRNMERLNDLNQQLSTGRRILSVSDDVPGARQVMHLLQENGKIDAYLENMRDAEDTLYMASSSAEQVLDILSRVKERAVQAATGTYSANDRQTMAEDVDGMLQTLLSLANVQHKGAYMFAGQATRTVPFVASKDAAGRIDATSYQGALLPTEAPVAPGVTTDMNVVGSEIFHGGGDLFGTVIELRDAIRTGDVQELRTRINDLDRGRDALLRGVGRLGERQAQLGILRNSTERMRQLNEQIISDRRDADMAELSVQYNSQMALLRVVMQVAASSAKPSIADFL